MRHKDMCSLVVGRGRARAMPEVAGSSPSGRDFVDLSATCDLREGERVADWWGPPPIKKKVLIFIFDF